MPRFLSATASAAAATAGCSAARRRPAGRRLDPDPLIAPQPSAGHHGRPHQPMRAPPCPSLDAGHRPHRRRTGRRIENRSGFTGEAPRHPDPIAPARRQPARQLAAGRGLHRPSQLPQRFSSLRAFGWTAPAGSAYSGRMGSAGRSQAVSRLAGESSERPGAATAVDRPHGASGCSGPGRPRGRGNRRAAPPGTAAGSAGLPLAGTPTAQADR